MLTKSQLSPMFACVLLLSLAPPDSIREGIGESVISLGGQARRQGGPPPYDSRAEVTVSGIVIGTETLTPPDRPEQTVLLLTVNGEKLGVFLGPSEWLAKQKFELPKGAAAEVLANTGFRYPGGAAVQPRSVKIGKRTLTVRDATGTPMWESGGRDQR